MRPSCLDCVAKHVTSAASLLSEFLHGYPKHDLRAAGELDQASQESELEYPALSEHLRQARKYIISHHGMLLVRDRTEDPEAKQAVEIISAEIDALLDEVSEKLVEAFVKDADISPEASGTAGGTVVAPNPPERLEEASERPQSASAPGELELPEGVTIVPVNFVPVDKEPEPEVNSQPLLTPSRVGAIAAAAAV